MHAVAALEDDLPHRAIVHPLGQFLHSPAVPGHQPDAHLEVLLRCGLTQREHALARGPINRHGLLHENVQALLDRVGEVHPAEGRRGREDDNVARLQAVDCLLVGVEPDELSLDRHVELATQGRVAVEVLVALPELPSKRSAIATSLMGPHLVDSALAAAPVPRPPQPTRAT